jgi:hypothetical protein
VRREHLVPCGESDQARRASRRAAYQEVEAERRRTRRHTPPDPPSHRGHGRRLSESSPHRARADAKRRSLAPAGSGRYFELKLETLIRRQVVAGPRNHPYAIDQDRRDLRRYRRRWIVKQAIGLGGQFSTSERPLRSGDDAGLLAPAAGPVEAVA